MNQILKRVKMFGLSNHVREASKALEITAAMLDVEFAAFHQICLNKNDFMARKRNLQGYGSIK